MAIVPCVVCEQDGCSYCKFTGCVENGDYVPPDQRPIEAVAADWPEEPTQEMPAFTGRAR